MHAFALTSLSSMTMRQWRWWQRQWPLLLAVVYIALIPVLSRLEEVRGVTFLLGASAVVCLVVSLWRLGRHGTALERAQSRAVSLLAPLGIRTDTLRVAPPVVLWLPLPVSLSWVAGAMARVNPAQADYYLAFGVWVVALALLLVIFLVPVAVENWERLPALVRAIPWREVAAVAFITGVAFAVRFIDLADKPGPFWGDEGQQAIAGLKVARGLHQNFFDLGRGAVQPALTYSIMALPFKLFGPSVLWARLPTAIVGTATVPLLYLMLREMFDRRVALVGAAVLAVLHFHVHYSRVDFTSAYDALFAVLVLYFAFRAMRTGALWYFALTGLIAGLILHFNASARVVPLALILLLIFMTLKTRGAFVLRNFWGLAILFTAFVIAVLPAALYFDGIPGTLSARWESQTILGLGWLESQKELTGRSELHILWDQFQRAVGTLVVYKEVQVHFNAQVPLLDAVGGVFLVVGGVYALFHLFQPRFFALYALFLLTVVLGGMLLQPPVGSQRLVATTPVTAAFVAVGLITAADAGAKLVPRFRKFAPAAVGVAVLLIAFMNLSFYFGTYLPSDNFGFHLQFNSAAAADELESFDDSYTVYFVETDHQGVSARDQALQFRARDKVIVDVRKNGGGKSYIEGRAASEEEIAALGDAKTNALFFVAIGPGDDPREPTAQLVAIEQTCPEGKKSEVRTLGRFDEVVYVWYEVLDARECVRGLKGVVLGPFEG